MIDWIILPSRRACRSGAPSHGSPLVRTTRAVPANKSQVELVDQVPFDQMSSALEAGAAGSGSG